jgi:hypothetical protein
VLLLEFHLMATGAGWSSTEVREVGTQADFRGSMARMALRLLRSMSLKERMVERAKRALAVVKSFSVSGPGGIRVQLEVDPVTGAADSGDIEQDLADLLVEIGEVARTGGTGALFLLDEMQNLDQSSLAALCLALHRVSQQNLPVALVGAGLPSLPMMLRGAKPYSSRLFTYHDIVRLSEAATRVALLGPAKAEKVDFEGEAVELIVKESGGYPYFLQEYGRVLWDEVEESPITADHVRAVAELVDDSLNRTFFDPPFELATDAEQRYLIAIAHLGDGPYRSLDAAAAAGYESIGSASYLRDGLIEKELLWSPRRGFIDFTVPRFAQYLRNAHSLEDR